MARPFFRVAVGLIKFVHLQKSCLISPEEISIRDFIISVFLTIYSLLKIILYRQNLLPVSLRNTKSQSQNVLPFPISGSENRRFAISSFATEYMIFEHIACIV